MYVLTPEAVAMAESDNNSPNVRKLPLPVRIQFHHDMELRVFCTLVYSMLDLPHSTEQGFYFEAIVECLSLMQ